jgi:hypothetical protein
MGEGRGMASERSDAQLVVAVFDDWDSLHAVLVVPLKTLIPSNVERESDGLHNFLALPRAQVGADMFDRRWA